MSASPCRRTERPYFGSCRVPPLPRATGKGDNRPKYRQKVPIRSAEVGPEKLSSPLFGNDLAISMLRLDYPVKVMPKFMVEYLAQ